MAKQQSNTNFELVKFLNTQYKAAPDNYFYMSFSNTSHEDVSEIYEGTVRALKRLIRIGDDRYDTRISNVLVLYMRMRMFLTEQYARPVPQRLFNKDVTSDEIRIILDKKMMHKFVNIITSKFEAFLAGVLSKYSDPVMDSFIFTGKYIFTEYELDDGESVIVSHHSGDTHYRRYDDDEHTQASIQARFQKENGNWVAATSTGFIIPLNSDGKPNYNFKSREGADIHNKEFPNAKKKWDYSRPKDWKIDHPAGNSSPIEYSINITPLGDGFSNIVMSTYGHTRSSYTFKAKSDSISIHSINCEVAIESELLDKSDRNWEDFMELVQDFIRA